jgi:hypothetical protein
MHLCVLNLASVLIFVLKPSTRCNHKTVRTVGRLGRLAPNRQAIGHVAYHVTAHIQKGAKVLKHMVTPSGKARGV